MENPSRTLSRHGALCCSGKRVSLASWELLSWKSWTWRQGRLPPCQAAGSAPGQSRDQVSSGPYGLVRTHGVLRPPPGTLPKITSLSRDEHRCPEPITGATPQREAWSSGCLVGPSPRALACGSPGDRHGLPGRHVALGGEGGLRSK